MPPAEQRLCGTAALPKSARNHHFSSKDKEDGSTRRFLTVEINMATILVTSLNDSGAGSLRAAILAANASPTGATIDFRVSGTINLVSALPSIQKTVTLDATTAPGYVVSGAPVVELNFAGHAGLVFAAGSSGSVLMGLALGNASGNGVTLNSSDITLTANYIGLHADGRAFGNALDGIHVNSTSSGNLIGLNPEGHSGLVTNVISGNGGNGIAFYGSADNTVVGNRIGTDPGGTTAMGNGQNGILITGGSHDNTIGGTVYVDSATGQANDPTGNKGQIVPPVLVTPPLGNLVSGNGQNGVLIQNGSENNVLNGNFVGTGADGVTAVGNGGDGVQILNADNNALIGCTFFTEPFVFYNVLSGNAGNGLHITNSDDVTVQANFLGIGADNATTVGNGQNGILVDGDSRNTTVGGVIPLGNVSAGNTLNGIYVTDTASGFTTFNTFGGLLAFQGAAPNGNDGILVDSTGGNILIRTNVFSGNLNNGIEITGDAWGVTVDPNIVGLNTEGSSTTVNTGVGLPSMANGNNGLLIGGTAHDNTIGGYSGSVIPQNTFSGNAAYGIEIADAAYDNQVFNTAIGTNSLITAGLGNGLGGILVSSTGANNLIGGVEADSSVPRTNYISGNTGNGITLAAGVSGDGIVGNAIGLDRADLPLPNTGQAIANGSSGQNFIVGNEPSPPPPGSPPVITSNGGGATASITMVVSQTLVTTVTAIDTDPGQSLSYAITGGEDLALFDMLNGNQLNFVSAPNLNDLPPAGSTPGYQVSVSVADDVGAFSSQQLTVWVSPSPVLTGAGVSFYNAIGGVYVDLPAQVAERGDVGASYWQGPAGVTPIAVDQLAGVHNATGSAFNDLLMGDSAGGLLAGLAGDDLLYGDASPSAATGAVQAILSGGAGSNALYGGSAFNTFVAGDADGGVNQIWGGASQMIGVAGFANNTLSFADMAVGRSVYVDLLTGHNAYVNDGASNDGAYTLEDAIVNVPNVVGSSGGDIIIADNGTARLQGGGGADALHAGSGPDTFAYAAYADSNLVTGYDTVVGFKIGTDRIDLSALNVDASNLVIQTSGTSNSVYVERTPGVFNAGTDLAIVVNTTTPGGLHSGDFIF